MSTKNTVIIAVAGGFYFFGEEVKSSQEGYITLAHGAMFGGFSGGKGLPGVARGDKSASVILDFFEDDAMLNFPTVNVYGIFPSIDLSTWKNTEKR